MASLSQDAKGYRIRFKNKNGEHKSIRLGQMPAKMAEKTLENVEVLITAMSLHFPPDPITMNWVANIGDDFHSKLAGVGLVERRQQTKQMKVSEFLDSYIVQRKDIKPNTKRNLISTRRKLIEFLGENKKIHEIKSSDASAWKRWMETKYSSATLSKDIKHAKMFFREAIREELIEKNPFQDLKSSGEQNRTRLKFIAYGRIEKIMEFCDTQWKLIIALSRIGGLRCPSETLNLKWSDIDWEKHEIRIDSPKTEHLKRGPRVVPIFPELKPFLEAARNERKEDDIYVITKYRGTNQNLRTQFQRFIKRAKDTPWPRLFHNLRASRQIELCDEFKLHNVCDFIGNSPVVAESHYLKSTEQHYQKAKTIKTLQY